MPWTRRARARDQRDNPETGAREQFCSRQRHWVPVDRAYPYASWCKDCQAAARRERRAQGEVATTSEGAVEGELVATEDPRRFGVEVEFIYPRGMQPARAVAALTAAGLTVVNESYTHNGHSATAWVMKRDGSLTGGSGGELVSPPLSGPEGLRAVDTALRVLRGLGCRVNASCGLHVHHDASDLTLDQIKAFVALYHAERHNIDRLMTARRRSDGDHEYCGGIEDVLLTLQGITSLNELRTGRRDGDRYGYGYLGFQRYRNVNLCAYQKHGTIELRQHQGTLNSTKTLAWIKLGQALFRRATRPAEDTFEAFMQGLGLDTATAAHLRRRAAA